MQDVNGPAVALRPTSDAAVLIDLSCGRCDECAAGAPLWCRDVRDDGPAVFGPLTHEPRAALAALLAGAALLEAPGPGAVLVADRPDGILARLVRVLRPDASVVAGDPDDARIRTAVAELTATGRADTVVTATDARRAVKAVRRGGHVCVALDGGALPSTTELVQREVTLVGPRTLAGLLSDTLRQGVDAALHAA